MPIWVAATVVVAVCIGGGFGQSARLTFAAMAGAALIVATLQDSSATARFLRSPAVALLLALAALSALSTAWSLGIPTADGLTWALVVAGYAALGVAAAVVCTRPGGCGFLTWGICLIAMASAAIGLVAVAREHEPLALFLDGSWRPAGTFEYPPALALLEVMALPGLTWAAARRRGPTRALVLAGIALAATVVVLSGSRLQVVFALLVLAGGLAGVPRVRRRPAVRLATLAGLVACGAVALAALLPGQSNGELGVAPSHGRVEIWSAAIETARERPWLGSGVESFELASASNQGGTAVRYAHDLPLDAWVELGAMGLALVVCLYVAVGAAVWRVRRQPAGWLFGIGALAFPLANLVDWSWHLAGLGAVWALCLGGALAAQPGSTGYGATSASRSARLRQ